MSENVNEGCDCKSNLECLHRHGISERLLAHKPVPDEAAESARTLGCRSATTVDSETTLCNSPIAVPRQARNHESGGVCPVCGKKLGNADDWCDHKFIESFI